MQRLYPYLPNSILNVLFGIPEEIKKDVCEVRLRRNGVLSLSTYTENFTVTLSGNLNKKIRDSYICSASDVAYTVMRLTEGSVYRHMNTINSGYIVTKEGIRAGVAGEAIYTSGKVSSVADFMALNIRLPRNIDSSGDAVLRYIRSNPNASLLIYSPAGYGKTTVIRSVAKGIATGKYGPARRVAVIDERGEILPDTSSGLTDRFLGYRKPDGIEIAVRLFSPEYIICDEIGLADDTQAILSVQNVGIPFIATTHGNGINEIMLRPNIKKLIDHRVFDSFARLERKDRRCVTVFEELCQ